MFLKIYILKVQEQAENVNLKSQETKKSRSKRVIARRALVSEPPQNPCPSGLGEILLLLCLPVSPIHTILGCCLHRIRDKSCKMNPGEVQVKA